VRVVISDRGMRTGGRLHWRITGAGCSPPPP
jgi:hypothetical protein